VTILIDAAIYLTLSALAFAIVVLIHRAVLGPVRTNQERALFWSVWIALSVMLVGLYHVATGDVTFGRALMLLALALALIIAVGSNITLAAACSSRRSPAAPDDASRITHQTRRQLAANDRRLLR